MWHHDRCDRLAEIAIGDAEYGRLQHPGQFIDLHFDLFRVDVVSAGDDQVAVATDNAHVPARIDLPDVTGTKETIGGELGAGLRGHAPVAAEHAGTTHLDGA